MVNPLRIAICTAAVGCGHTRAALALRSALRQMEPGAIVHVVEALDLAPTWFVKAYRDGYLAAIGHVPRVAGWLYDASDRAPRGKRSAHPIERGALRRLLDHPSIAAADAVVTTHFLCARVLSDWRGEGRLLKPLAVCVTDQHPHGLWLVPHADRVMVGSEAAAQAAVAAGLRRTGVVATGIPIEPEFGSENASPELRRELDLPEDRRIVLVCGGGLGLGGIEEAVDALVGRPGHFHVVVVCGRNEGLRKRLRHYERPTDGTGPSCRVMGFTTRMAGLMRAADVLVGKPGGLTTAEAVASGLPMVLLNPLPGQEERNAAWLVASGAAVLAANAGYAGVLATELIRDPVQLSRMRTAALELGFEGSAERAATEVMGLINRSREPELALVC